MDELGKSVRWSVPGGVFFLLVLLTVTITRLAWRLWGIEVTLIENDATNLALGVFASVPIGYIIYQLYYSAYLHPNRWFRFSRGVPSAETLRLAYPEGTAPVFSLTERKALAVRFFPWKDVFCPIPVLWPTDEQGAPVDLRSASGVGTLRKQYELRAAAHVQVDVALLRVFSGGDQERAAYQRSDTRLSEIYHTLGAARKACWLGWLVGSAWVFATGDGHQWLVWKPSIVGLAVLLSPAIPALLCGWLAWRFHLNRRDCWRWRDQVRIAALTPGSVLDVTQRASSRENGSSSREARSSPTS